MGRLFFGFLLVLIGGCRQGVASHSTGNEEPQNGDVRTRQREKEHVADDYRSPFHVPFDWTDSLLQTYVANSENPLIQRATKGEAPEEWLFDQTITTDTATFLVFQLGHDEFDDGRQNKRFVTDQWVYIDSSSRLLYEYDFAGDRLKLWIGQ